MQCSTGDACNPCQCECFADRWALGGLGGSYKLIFTKAVYGWVDGFCVILWLSRETGHLTRAFFATQDFKRQPCFDDMLSFKAQTLFLQSRPDGEAVRWRASGRTDIVRNRPVILQRQPQENLLWRSLSPVFAVVAYLNYWTKNESSCRNSVVFFFNVDYTKMSMSGGLLVRWTTKNRVRNPNQCNIELMKKRPLWGEGTHTALLESQLCICSRSVASSRSPGEAAGFRECTLFA